MVEVEVEEKLKLNSREKRQRNTLENPIENE
jgi:hypothetical protein